MPKPSLLPFIPKKPAAWLRGPKAPKAPRNVRVQSTTPRSRFEGPVYAPVPRDKFELKVRVHTPDPVDPSKHVTSITRLEFTSRKDRRDHVRGDTGQRPKPLPARRVRPMPEYRRDSTGAAVTLVGQEPRRVWLGGISAKTL